MNHRYHTPDALRRDARTLAAEAQRRGREIYTEARLGVMRKAKATDRVVRSHPYRGMAVALGLGAIAGYFLSRRQTTYARGRR